MPYDRVARLPLEDHDSRPPLRRTLDGGLPGEGIGDESDNLGAGFHGLGGGVGAGSEQRRGLGGEVTGLVVAYWSYDYRDHAMGHLTRGLFCSHQVRFSVLFLFVRQFLA